MNKLEKMQHLAGFCTGLSNRAGIALNEDERKALLYAGKLLFALAKAIQETDPEKE